MVSIRSRTTLVSEHSALAQVVSKHPNTIIYLLSALRFLNIATQSHFEVWIAIPNKAQAPRLDYPHLYILRLSAAALTEVIENYWVDGVMIQVTSIAKSIADCFKLLNKIGLDIALEALRDAWQKKQVSMDEFWHYAILYRVANVMRPPGNHD